MSPFGLFDLLKTLLPAPDQTPQPTAPPPVNMETEHPIEEASSSPSAPTSTNQAQPPKTNACADFLYRHEQRARGVKDGKKRLD